MKHTLRKALAISAFISLGLPFAAYAQTDNTSGRTFTPREKKTFLSGNTDCFEHYKYGSVSPVFGALEQKVKAGGVVSFEGRLENRNAYPLVDVTLYVKIARKEQDADVAHRNGDNIVDQFIAAQGVTIPAANGEKFGEKSISFSWNVPQAQMGGEYRVLSYVSVASKMNMNGLSFMDDVNAGGATFTVEGSGSQPFFMKDGVTLNNAQYYFAGWSPSFKKDESVVVSVPVFNPASSPADIHVTWRSYNWDALRAENIIETVEEDYKLPAGGIQKLNHKAPTAKGSATYVVAELSAGGTKSILNMRFSREGFPEGRFNFVGIEKFDQKEKSSVIACFQTTMEKIPDATLSLTALSEKGEVLGAQSIPVDLLSNIAGYETLFDFKGKERVTLNASLKQGSKLLDQVSLNYDCKEAKTCVSTERVKQEAGKTSATHNILVVVATIILLGVTGVIIYLRMKKQIPPVSPIAMLFIALMLAFAPQSSYAESTSVGYSGRAAFNQGPSDPDAVDMCNKGIQPRTLDGRLRRPACGVIKIKFVDVTYNGSVAYNANASIANGAVVPVGTTISFSNPRSDSDISWFASGSVSDSPYGYWNWPSNGMICSGANEFPTTSGLNRYGYSVVNYPGMTMVGDQNASCSGNSCTVTGHGPVRIRAVFPAANGVFGVYFRVSCSEATNDAFSVPSASIAFNYTGTGGTPPTLWVNPSSVTVNHGAPLPAGSFTWGSTGADSCSVSGFGGYNGPISLSGTSGALGAQTSSWSATVTCSNTAGSVSRIATVNVLPPPVPPTVTAYSNGGTTIVGSATSDFSWWSSNATGCSVSSTLGYWNPSAATSGSVPVGLSNGAVTFTVICRNSGGATAADSITYTYMPPRPPAPSVTVNASPTTIPAGSGSTIGWTATDVPGRTCALSSFSMGQIASGLPGAGTYYVSGIISTSNFFVTCTNSGGSGTGSVTVSTVSPPISTISVSPTTITAGASTMINWNSWNSTSCSISPLGWSGTSGTRLASGVWTTTTYTLTCNGPGGTHTSFATVNVIGVPSATLTAAPMTVVVGGYSTLSWYSSGASNCSVLPVGFNGLSGTRTVGPINTATTYTLSCSGPGGSASQNVTVGVVAPPPVPVPSVSVTPSARTVTSGLSTSFTWSSSNATACNRYRGGVWDQGGVGTSGSFTSPALFSSVNYEIRCVNMSGPGPYPEGSGWHSATVSAPPTPPIVSITASPTSIATGGASTITWSSSGATSCTVTPGSWSGTSGSRSTGALAATQGYAISCSGPGGTTNGGITVNVSAPSAPVVAISVSPGTVPQGAASTVTWSSSNATSCTVNPGGWNGLSGSRGSPALFSSTTYTVTCSGPGGVASNSATVNVSIPPSTPTVTMTPAARSVSSGDTTSFTWSTTNATICNRYRFGNLEMVSVGTSGSFASPSLSANVTYEIRCANVSGGGPYPEGSGFHSVTILPPPPALDITPPHDFIDAVVGETSTYPVTVTNTGGDGLSCVLSLTDASGRFSLGGGANINNLGSGRTRSVNISFDPLTAGVDINATLHAVCSNPSMSRDIPVHGRGVLALGLPTVINLGDVPVGVPRYFNALKIRNNKDTPANVCLTIPRASDADKAFTCESTDALCSKMTRASTEQSFKVGVKPVAPPKIPKGYRQPISTVFTAGIMSGGRCIPMTGGSNTIIVNSTAVEPVITFNER